MQHITFDIYTVALWPFQLCTVGGGGGDGQEITTLLKDDVLRKRDADNKTFIT
jgi:hypothetical protein